MPITTQISLFQPQDLSLPATPTLNLDVQMEIIGLLARLLQQIIQSQTSQDNFNEKSD